MRRNFQNNLVKVKNKHFFGAAQNVKLFFKDTFLTNLIMVYYIEPFFSLREQETFNKHILGKSSPFVTNSVEEERESFKRSRQEIKIDNKKIYFVIQNQCCYVDLNEETESDWYEPFSSSLGFTGWLRTSKTFDKKYKDFCLEFFKGSVLKNTKISVWNFLKEVF